MKELLNAILDRKDLTPAQAQQLLNALIDPATTPAQVGAALAALRTKGETYQEIAGLATAMRSAAIDPSLDQGPGPHTPCIDIVGTGGDGAQTLNISTAAALLLAAAGASPTTNTRPWRVIKHGNRAISSACGSADVLAELGVPMPLAPAAARTLLEATGFTFLFAPHYHGATASVQRLRRELGVRTVFNLLGPLTNPARPTALLIGAPSPRTAQLLALAAHAMGQHATVVHTPAPAGPCDEVTSLAPFTVTLASESPSQSEPLVREQDLDPRPAHAPAAEPSQGHPLAPLAGRDAPFNARAIVECFNARPSPFADSVVLTAALALATLRQELDKPWPSDELRAAITDGRAAGLLRTIRSLAPALREQSAQQIQPA